MPYNKKIIRSSGKVGNIASFMSPLKLFDYLAAGKVIIATKINTLEEIVENQKNCILINNLSISNWYRVIKSVSNNKKIYRRIAKNSFNLSKKYSYYDRAKKFLDIK